MKTELETIKQRLSEVTRTGKYDTILFHPGTAEFVLSLLTKQEEQPQANDAEKFPKSTWEADALRRKVKRFEAEIQSLKKANAELVTALYNVTHIVKALELRYVSDWVEVKEAEQLLSKHDKQ